MLGLGLGATLPLTYAAVIVEDYFWELPSPGNITPLATGITDLNEVWDLDGTDYMPVGSGWISPSEGYWELNGDDDLQPLDV
tara:strand:+ start:661 stop:906 length:246 start_codon:yes stop_codon:yes gene_type:complete